MNCPHCGGGLAERLVGLNRAASCPGCSGVWVPFESCEAVLRRLEDLAPESEPAAAAPPAGRERMKCPGCGGDMVRVKSQGAAVAAMHTCLVCFGRWVDGAEMARTRARGLGGFFRRLLRALVPKSRAPHSGPPPAHSGGAGAAPAPRSSEESARMETPEKGNG